MPRRKPSRSKRSRAHPAKPRKAATQKAASISTPVHWVDRLGSHPILLLVVLTSLAYLNAWPENPVVDDVSFAVADRYLSLNLREIAGFFSQDLWAADGARSGLYRPLLLVSIMMDAHLFGEWSAGYYLVNILLHVLTTIAVFGLIRQLMVNGGVERSSATLAAFLGALIFGVHPVHAEVVNSIFNRSEMLVTLGASAGLWWFLRVVDAQPWRAWCGISLVYLVILFCRETAAVYPGLVVMVLWLTSSAPWLERARKCLPVLFLLIPLSIYLGLRAQALNPPQVIEPPAATIESVDEVHQERQEEAKTDDLVDKIVKEFLGFESKRLLFAFNYWQDALRLSVWPHPLLMHHSWPSGNPWVALALQVLLIVAAMVAYSHKRPEFLIGLLFFYLAFLPASRIIGEHGVYPVMTERSIYFPSTGLAILFAGGMLWLANRVGRRYAIASALTIAMVLMPLAWARNAEWVTDVSLGEADYRRGHKPLRVLQGLVTDHLKAGNFRRPVEICDRHLEPGEMGWLLRIKCGEAYSLAGRMNEAEQAYLGAIWDHRGKGRAHYELAVFYLRVGRRSDAKHQFELAIEVDDAPFLREFRTAMMLIQLYPSSQPHLLQARTHLQNTLRLQPQSFQARQVLEQLDDRLGL